MKILIYGAGVLGSLYAAKLQRAGQHVTVLARGKRLEELRENGILLLNESTGEQTATRVEVIESLEPDRVFDLVLVIVRKNQLPSVLPSLANSHFTPNVLFMVNNAAGPAEITAALGRHRVLLGFAGAGGAYIDGVVRYRITAIQKTTLGELDGANSQRIHQISWILHEAGFPTETCSDMDAWLKTHVAMVSPVANAIYMAGGDTFRLARTRDALVLMVRAVREGLRVLRRLGYPITPFYYKALEWVPEPLLVFILKKAMATETAQLVLARHANAARDEMQTLAGEFKLLATQSGLATPSMDQLAAYIDPKAPPVEDGKSSLPLNWRRTVAGVGLLAAIGITLGWVISRNKR